MNSPVAVVILDKCLNRGRDCLLGSPGDYVRMLPYVNVIGLKNGSNGRQLYDVFFDVGLVSVSLQAANVECGSYLFLLGESFAKYKFAPINHLIIGYAKEKAW